MRSIAFFLMITATAYLTICVFYYFQQDRILFMGARPVAPPSDPRVQPVEHVVDGLHLRGVRVRAHEERTVLLYFGGNAEPVVSNVWPMLGLRSVTAYLIDYRGYGDSDGTPSEGSLRKDALAHFDWIRGQHPKGRIVLFGRSLGTALALHVAARREVAGLILVSPFTSLRDVARFHLPWLPVAPLMRNAFDSLRDWRRIETATLAIAAENDSVIPLRFTEAFLRERLGGVEAHVIPGTDHNDLMATAAEWSLVRTFLDRLP